MSSRHIGLLMTGLKENLVWSVAIAVALLLCLFVLIFSGVLWLAGKTAGSYDEKQEWKGGIFMTDLEKEALEMGFDLPDETEDDVEDVADIEVIDYGDSE